MQIIQLILLFILFTIASVVDIKKREIPNIVNLLTTTTGFLSFSFANFAGILIALPFLSVAVVFKGKLGGGDVKFMAATGFVVGFYGAIIASIVGLTASLLYCALRYIFSKLYRKSNKEVDKSFPLAPFLSIGCLTALILQIGGLF